LVVGNRVYGGHSEENVTGSSMGALVALEISGTGDETAVRELWKIEELVVGRSAPLLIEDRIYVIDDRCKMWVINADDGTIIAERIKVGDSKQWGSLVYADGKIYALTENGRWAIMKPSEDGVEFLDKGRINGEAFLASPIVADGRLYFLGTGGLYCVGNGQGEGPKSAPMLGEEAPLAENAEPAWLQVFPVESIVMPGESVDFTFRAYNDLGQLIGEVPAGDLQFEVTGAGRIEGAQYQSPADASHTAAVITAKMGDVTGTARVRVVPPLPWKFTFDELKDAPLPWVGARYRNVVRPVDGSPALVKVSTIPKGARSQGWMGPSDLSNYTVMADVKGTRMSDQLPDIGLIAQGYTLDLMGNSQKLQIRTWTPQLRMSQEVEFPWQEDIWYRMKFQASVEEDASAPEGKVAVLRGKVWPKGEPEPKEWTVEARDTSPQTQGSPGFFGNAKVAELHLDNIEVVPNP
jgi:hypothetical protein